MLNRDFNFSQWRQWAIVFLAGVLVLVTTACGSAQAALPGSHNSGNVNSESAEGMYPYKDTDMDTKAADTKADRMIREADQRIQQGNNEPLGEKVGDVKDRVGGAGESAKQAVKNIGKSTQQAAENAQESLDDLGQNVRGTINGAAARGDTVLSNQSTDNPYRRADPVMPGDMTDNRTR